MRTLTTLLLSLLVFCGCAASKVDSEREAQATRAYERLVSGDISAFRSDGIDGFAEALTDDLIAQMRGAAPSGDAQDAKVIRWTSGMSDGINVYELVQEFHYPYDIVIWRAVMARPEDGEWGIASAHIQRVSRSEAALMGFTLANRGPTHYLVLALAVLAPLFCLATAAVAAWRKRWGWFAGSLIGVGILSFNWATGAMFFNVAQVSLLSAGFLRGGSVLDPWFITLSLPLPAAMFWILGRWRAKEPRQKNQASDVRRYP